MKKKIIKHILRLTLKHSRKCNVIISNYKLSRIYLYQQLVFALSNTLIIIDIALQRQNMNIYIVANISFVFK